MTILLRAICRFTAIPIKLSTAFFTKLEQKISQFAWKYKTPQIAKAVLRKKKWTWRNQPAWLQTIHIAAVIKTVCYWHKHRNVDQGNKLGNLEINPGTCEHLIFHKGGKNIQQEKECLFNKGCWENRTATCKRMILEYSLTPYTKINPKWIKDQTRSCKTLRGKHRTLFDTNHSIIFSTHLLD